MLSKYLYVLPLGCLGILGGDFKPYPIIHLEFRVIRGKEINLIHGLLVQILMIFYKPIRFYYIFLWSIPKRVYQNNAAVILHLIKYIVTTFRMFKHQNVVVKHFEDTVQHFTTIRIVCRFLLQAIRSIFI